MEPASGSKESRFWGGFVLSGAFVVWGVVNIVTQSARLRYNVMMTGTDAVIMGVERILLGAFFNVHYYWTVSERLWKYSVLAKVLLVIAFIGILVWRVVRLALKAELGW